MARPPRRRVQGKPRHIKVRAYAYSRRRVFFASVREQEQHQQHASPRSYIHAPSGKVPLFIRIAIFAGKAHINTPAGIARIVGMRKPHREDAKTVARKPTPFADDLIERGMENRRIDGFPERLLSISRQSNDWFGPGRWVIGIARQIAHMISRASSANSRGKARSTRTNPS